MKKKTAKVLHWIEFIIVIFVVLIFILSNPKTLNYITKEATDSYNLKYESLSGNILTNIHIKDISYQGDIIAQDAEVDFNLLKLLILRVDIESIKFSKVNIKHLKRFINSIPKTSSKTDENANSKTTMPFFVAIHDISLDILPYKKDSLDIKKLRLSVKDFSITDDVVVDNLKVDLKSNYFDLAYSGSYHDSSLYIDDFDLENLNIKKILLLKDIIKNDSDSNETIIKNIEIKKAKLTIKPYSAGHYKLKSLSININNLKSNLKSWDAQTVKLKADTNIWKLSAKGDINSSVYKSKVKVDLDDKYMKKFIPNMNFNSLNPVNVRLKIDKDRLIGDISAKSNKLFEGLAKELDIKVKDFKTHAVFDFKKMALLFNTKAKFSSKYSNEFNLDGNFTYDREHFIGYDGDIKFKDFKNLDKRAVKLLKDTKIHFSGDEKGLYAKLNSNYLKVDYDSNNTFIKPKIYLTSKEIDLTKFDLNLTKPIKSLFIVEANLDYKNINSSTINYQINSNAVDIDGEYSIDKNSLDFITSLSKESILKNEKFKVEKLFPITSKVTIDKNIIKVISNSDNINLNTDYFINSGDINISVDAFDTKLNASRKNSIVDYDIISYSLKSLLNGIKNYYKLPELSIDGEVKLVGNYHDEVFDFDIDSKWFLDEYSQYKYLFLENTMAKCYFKKDTLSVENFQTNLFALDRYRKIYSNKASKVEFLEDKTVLDFYINDSIKIKGNIAENTNLNISTYNYHLNEPEADIHISTNLNYYATTNSSTIKGKVSILDGVIKYKPKTSHDINDQDIIFVNRKKNKNTSKSSQNIDIKFITKRAIYYKQGKNKIKFNTDLTLLKKSRKVLKALGTISIVDGVYYSENKRFELGSGKILFSGNLLNPFLELKAYYKKDPYNITIMIGGKLDAPILNFSSSPYLTQNDILSILLFNTKASSLTNSESNSNPALSLFGSSFAKGILDTVGIKLDRVELSTTKEGSLGFEVEKRVGRKTTIIYQNDLVQTIKIRYQNTQNIETDLTFSPDSSSIDIIYKNEK